MKRLLILSAILLTALQVSFAQEKTAFKQAEEAFKTKQYAEAEKLFQSCYDSGMTGSYVTDRLSTCYLKNGKTEVFEKFTIEAWNKSEHPKLAIKLGNYYTQSNDQQKAIKYLNLARSNYEKKLTNTNDNKKAYSLQKKIAFVDQMLTKVNS